MNLRVMPKVNTVNLQQQGFKKAPVNFRGVEKFKDNLMFLEDLFKIQTAIEEASKNVGKVSIFDVTKTKLSIWNIQLRYKISEVLRKISGDKKVTEVLNDFEFFISKGNLLPEGNDLRTRKASKFLEKIIKDKDLSKVSDKFKKIFPLKKELTKGKY